MSAPYHVNKRALPQYNEQDVKNIQDMAQRVGAEFHPYEQDVRDHNIGDSWEKPRTPQECPRCGTLYRDGDRHACCIPETKPSNPKDAVGIRKVPFSCMSGPVLAEVGLGMLEGACKYGRHNYRAIGVRASVYFDAANRHLWGWWEGQDVDPDSGIHHISKLIADLMVLRDAMIRGNWVDDRPPRTDDNWIPEANKKAGNILDKYPNPKEPYLEAAE